MSFDESYRVMGTKSRPGPVQNRNIVQKAYREMKTPVWTGFLMLRKFAVSCSVKFMSKFIARPASLDHVTCSFASVTECADKLRGR